MELQTPAAAPLWKPPHALREAVAPCLLYHRWCRASAPLSAPIVDGSSLSAVLGRCCHCAARDLAAGQSSRPWALIPLLGSSRVSPSRGRPLDVICVPPRSNLARRCTRQRRQHGTGARRRRHVAAHVKVHSYDVEVVVDGMRVPNLGSWAVCRDPPPPPSACRRRRLLFV
jgi:hypothetical protein